MQKDGHRIESEKQWKHIQEHSFDSRHANMTGRDDDDKNDVDIDYNLTTWNEFIAACDPNDRLAVDDDDEEEDEEEEEYE